MFSSKAIVKDAQTVPCSEPLIEPLFDADVEDAQTKKAAVKAAAIEKREAASRSPKL